MKKLNRAKVIEKQSARVYRYAGTMFNGGGAAENAKIKEALVSERRISIDWIEDGRLGHLEAASNDGESFRGHYGYPTIPDRFIVELKRYDAEGEVLFFGTWDERDYSEQGIWVPVLEKTESENK